MTVQDMNALAPFLALAAGAVVLLLVIAARRSHRLAVAVTLLTLAFAGGLLPAAAGTAPRPVTALLRVDAFALFYTGLLVAAGTAVTAFAYGYLRPREEQREEYYVLLLVSVLGGSILTAAVHLAAFFLGLEILSVGLYGLIAYLRDRRAGIEAGLKYLVLAGASSAFLLFGMALLYERTGALDFAGLGRGLAAEPGSVTLYAGLALVLVGVGFKLALVPFHLWTPDVYEGAPAPTTALLATVSKGAVFAVLLRLFAALGGEALRAAFPVLALIAAASMLGGNLLALRQRNVKRILAYSSIAHLGYLMVAFLAGGAAATEAVTFYLVAYFVTTLGAFGVVGLLSPAGRDAGDLDDFRALFWRRPAPAVLLTACLLSLAGIPLTAGFVGKFTVLAAGVGAASWTLVLILVAGSAIGIYYYLRVVVAMASTGTQAAPGETGRVSGPREAGPARAQASLPAGIALAALLLFVIGFGVYPAPLIRLIEATARAIS